MRKLVVALVVACLAFALAGCGGGEEPAATTTTPEPVPAAAPAAAATVLTDRSPTESSATITPAFPSTLSTPLPEAVQKKLDAGRPMLMFFYDTQELETKTERAEIDAVLAEYRGLIDLVAFDVTAKAGAVPSDAAKASVSLANDLGIKGTPYIVIVDGNGFITWRWLGFVDRDLIDREVLRATE
ncbi:MAG: thioredoxin family protein [Coriobacteriia bacterium]